MKTIPCRSSGSATTFAGPWSVALFFLILPVVLRGADASPAPAAPEASTHSLFIGVDILVQEQKEFYPVENVVGGSFLIKDHGREVRVPMTEKPVGLKIKQALKLTKSSVTVANLKGERAYTPGNDPNQKFMASTSGNAAGAGVSLAVGDVIRTTTAVSYQANHPNQPTFGATPDYAAQAAAASRSLNAAAGAVGSDLNSSAYNAGKLQEELDKKLFDAMDVSFDLSAEKPIAAPYLVIVASYHEKEERPGETHNWIYAQALDAVGPEPHTVHIKQGGLPPGFELDKFQVHLYHRGREIASNVSEKRVPMTRDEAFEYLMLDYFHDHKGATVSAEPAMGEISPDLRGRAEYRQVYFVKVSKEGLPIGAYTDEGLSKKVEDPALESVINDVRFKPALDKGKPVDGIARLRLIDLSL